MVSFDDLDDVSLIPTGKSGRELAVSSDPSAGISLGSCRSRATVARYKCDKCAGSGRWVSFSGFSSGPCFKCKGAGMLKSDPQAARARRKAAEAKRAAELGATMHAYLDAHRAEMTWLGAAAEPARGFEFAQSLMQAFVKYGSLTDAQLAAVQRCMARETQRAVERAERKPDAVVQGAGFERMTAAFTAAKASGLKHPKFRVQALTFSLAGASSKNAGCLYVKAGDVYLGKIDSGAQFFRSRECSEEQGAQVAEIARDPLAAAVMHGKQTGQCSCCGRELENEESVRLGIGPICRRKWGL